MNLLVQTTVVKCGVQQNEINTHLLVVQNGTHTLNIGIDSALNHSVAVVVTILSCVVDFCVKHVVDVLNGLALVDIQVQSL